jgi:flagellar biosynthesis/type III secretory pathway M-ring protein FliF/YscJ
MSTEHYNAGHGNSPANSGEPRNETVAFEERDVKVRTIYWYLFSLVVATVLAFGAAIVILRVTTKMVADADAPTLPMRREMTEQQKMEHAYPPEPRLQGVPGHEQDPQQDLRAKVKADTQANEQLRWIDQASGIAQIPVSEAMKLIVERGARGTTPGTPAAKSPETAANAAAATTDIASEKTN